MKFRYEHALKTFSKKLRRQGTVGEAMLWLQLKGKQKSGYRFHRQKPMGSYIVDFWCPKLALVIEIDGSTHEAIGSSDAKRQQELESMGAHFLRFTEKEVQTNLEGVVSEIDHWIHQHQE